MDYFIAQKWSFTKNVHNPSITGHDHLCTFCIEQHEHSFAKKNWSHFFQRKYLHNNNVDMYIFVVVNVQPTRWSNGRWNIFSIYVYSMCKFKQDFKMDIFGQKFPLNRLIRAKERCFFRMLGLITCFLFISTPDHKLD